MGTNTVNVLFGRTYIQPSEGESVLELSNGFKTHIKDDGYIEKHGLVGKPILEFVNELSTLTSDPSSNLTSDELTSLDFTLTRLMVMYETGELYYYLIHAFGPDALNFYTWVRFVSDTDWRICVRAFVDMPTTVLEEYGAREWHNRTKHMRRSDIEQFLSAISARNDIYGSDSLPIEMVEGILFYKGNLRVK